MGCGPGGKVLCLSCRFKVTVKVRGKCGGTLIVRAGLTRRTRAELLLEGTRSGDAEPRSPHGTRTQAVWVGEPAVK